MELKEVLQKKMEDTCRYFLKKLLSGGSIYNIFFFLCGFSAMSLLFIAVSERSSTSASAKDQPPLPDMNFTQWVAKKPEMDDPGFLRFVKKNFLIPPSTKPYNLDRPEVKNPSDGQLQSVLHLLKSRGFFVEFGALEGELISNTLYLERELGWEGLLIEADPQTFKGLLKKNRKAWISPACISPTKYPIEATFYQTKAKPYLNGLTNERKNQRKRVVDGSTSVQCVPLYSLLLALNRTVVDFLSLDIEGSEMDVLGTIPFDKLIFKVVTIEITHVRQGRKAVRALMERHGYKLLGGVKGGTAGDYIFTFNITNPTKPKMYKL